MSLGPIEIEVIRNALTAAAAEMDGPLAEAAKVVEGAAAAVAASEAEAAAKQAEVAAAVRDLLALQGIQAPAPTP